MGGQGPTGERGTTVWKALEPREEPQLTRKRNTHVCAQDKEETSVQQPCLAVGKRQGPRQMGTAPVGGAGCAGKKVLGVLTLPDELLLPECPFL